MSRQTKYVRRELEEGLYKVGVGDTPNLDAFGRLRVSNPLGLFDAQFTYDLQPLLFEQLTSGTGATITHDTTQIDSIDGASPSSDSDLYDKLIALIA